MQSIMMDGGHISLYSQTEGVGIVINDFKKSGYLLQHASLQKFIHGGSSDMTPASVHKLRSALIEEDLCTAVTLVSIM